MKLLNQEIVFSIDFNDDEILRMPFKEKILKKLKNKQILKLWIENFTVYVVCSFQNQKSVKKFVLNTLKFWLNERKFVKPKEIKL